MTLGAGAGTGSGVPRFPSARGDTGRRCTRVASLIFLLAWGHGLLWATVVPLWQAPDEPLHYEYACLLAEKGHLLTPADISPALQARILRSLATHRFWEYLGGSTPDPLPVTFGEAEDFWLSRAGTQVADEPPLYYLLPALICQVLPGTEQQLWVMRAYSAVLSAGVVLLGWLTARELWPTRRTLSLAVAAWLGFQPMATFIGASVNNDSLANLGGAALAFTLVRGSRRGWNRSRLLALVALTVLLPLSKKSGLFGLPLTAVVLVVTARRTLSRRQRWCGALAVGGLVLGLAVLALWPVPGQAAAWGRRGTMRYDARTAVTAHSGTWSLTLPALPPEQHAWLVQTVPSNQVHRLRGQEVTLRFWARSAEAAQAQITIDDGRDETTQDVRLTPRWQPSELHHRVAADADRLRVLIAPVAADEGSPAGFFDDLSLRCADGELLRNGPVEAPKRRWEGWTAGYLRLPLWFSRGLFDPTSYDAASLKRYGFYLAVTFGNFWGDYGWLTLPLPLWAYVLPALATLGAAVGWRWAGQLLPEPWWQRRALTWLGLQAVLVAAMVLLPMIGRVWQPQGRYLFPALVPLAVIFVLGWRGWGLRLGWRHWWIVLVLGTALLDVGSLLGVVVRHYYF